MTYEEVESLMRQYNEGILTKVEFENIFGNIEINKLLDDIEKHGSIFTIGSWCGPALETTQMTIEVTRTGHFFSMKKVK